MLLYVYNIFRFADSLFLLFVCLFVVYIFHLFLFHFFFFFFFKQKTNKKHNKHKNCKFTILKKEKKLQQLSLTLSVSGDPKWMAYVSLWSLNYSFNLLIFLKNVTFVSLWNNNSESNFSSTSWCIIWWSLSHHLKHCTN